MGTAKRIEMSTEVRAGAMQVSSLFKLSCFQLAPRRFEMWGQFGQARLAVFLPTR
jgi:hypothetical protein